MGRIYTNMAIFSTEDKNVELPFIVVVRKPDVQYGSNPSLLYTIPDRKQFHFAKVPTWDGNRKGYGRIHNTPTSTCRHYL